VVDVTGGEFSHTRQTDLSIVGGSATLTGVAILTSQVGFYSQDCTLTMRDCTVADNQQGGNLGDNTIVDLGTTSKPGGNIFKNIGFGLDVGGAVGSSIPAVGNTWKPLQGADGSGKYVQGSTLTGPVACDTSDINICIGAQSIQL
jgi:hypothetical protein